MDLKTAIETARELRETLVRDGRRSDHLFYIGMPNLIFTLEEVMYEHWEVGPKPKMKLWVDSDTKILKLSPNRPDNDKISDNVYCWTEVDLKELL